MEFTYKKGAGLTIRGEGVSVIISENGFGGSDHNIVIGKGYTGSSFYVNEPGEYEVNGVSILAQSSSMDEGVDIVELIIEDVRVLFVEDSFKYSKLVHDSLSDTDILVTRTVSGESQTEIVNKFDPQIIIPIGEEPIVREMLKQSSISIITETKKFKVKEDRFGAEEFVIEAVLLTE